MLLRNDGLADVVLGTVGAPPPPFAFTGAPAAGAPAAGTTLAPGQTLSWELRFQLTKEFGTLSLSDDSSDGPGGSANLLIDFSAGRPESFTGPFYATAGLTDVRATFDGTTVERLALAQYTLDLTNIDGHPSGPPAGIELLAFDVKAVDGQSYKLKTELTDAEGRRARVYVTVDGAQSGWRTVWISISDFVNSPLTDPGFDIRRAKLLGLLVERNVFYLDIHNPTTGHLS